MSLRIGIDVGRHAVRAVAVERARSGATRLVAHAEVIRTGGEDGPRSVAVAVAEAMTLMRRRGAVTVAASELEPLVRYVPSPPLSGDRLDRLLRLELSTHAEGENLAADAVMVPGGGDEQVHACVVAQPTQVEDLLRQLARAGVRPQRIGFGAMALVNAVPNDGAPTLLIDIGSTATAVTLVGEGGLIACRTIPIGAEGLADAAPSPLSDAAVEAEAAPDEGDAAAEGVADEPPSELDLGVIDDQLDEQQIVVVDDDQLLDIAMPPPPMVSGIGGGERIELSLDDDAPPAPGAVTMELARDVLGGRLQRQAEAIFSQVNSTLAWFRAQLKRSDLKPSAVLLCGGGAGMAGLDAYLARRFDVPVTVCDPCAAMAGEAPERSWAWATAIGLALDDGRGAVTIDLHPDNYRRRAAWRTQLIWPYIAAALLFAAAGIAGWNIYSWQEAERASRQGDKNYANDKRDKEKELKALERQHVAVAQDVRFLAARAHTNRNMLLLLRALKELAADNRDLWVDDLVLLTDAGVAANTGKKSAEATFDAPIPQGQVVLLGYVKFANTGTDEDRRRYFEAWYNKLRAWRATKDAAPLIAESEVREIRALHDLAYVPGAGSRKKVKTDTGTFPFVLELHFAPLRLVPPTESPASEEAR